jgi:hypothetical protein
MAHDRPVAATRVRSARRPSRLLIVLAALWMVLSLALGGALYAEPPSDTGGRAPLSRTVEH